jgi:surface polysaccharide O-acyltransferase-like enzyme
MGLSYLFWSFAFIFSTPFHWTYKVEEAVYVTWFIGLASYFYYAEMTIAMLIFLIPILIHYMAWGRKQEEKALYYMLIQIEETKDQKLFQTFSIEIRKRHASLTSPYWLLTLRKLQKLMKEEAEKQKNEK